MDRRFVCTVLAVLAVTVGAAALVNRTEVPPAAPLHENISGIEIQPETRPAQPAPETGDAYIIREYEGRVAVFSAKDDAHPEMILDLLVKYLPDYDRSQLREGIRVKDYQELVSRIEDYVS